jgi:cell division protein FtsZ
VQQECGTDNEADVIWGNGKDEALGNKIGITIIATGFSSKRRVAEIKTKTVGTIGVEKEEEKEKTKEEIPPIEIRNTEKETAAVEVPAFESMLNKTRIEESKEGSEIHLVNKKEDHKDSEKTEQPKITRKTTSTEETFENSHSESPNKSDSFFSFRKKGDKMPPGVSHTISSTNETREEEKQPTIEEENEAIKRNMEERASKLKSLSQIKNPEDVSKLEKEPAYIRKNIDLNSPSYSSESVVSRYTLGEDEDNNPVIKTDNSFLHDNVD